MENQIIETIDIDNLDIPTFRNFVEDKVFSIDFVKKSTGKRRRMNARLEVSKGVTGNRPEVTAKRKETLNAQNMITVFDMAKGEFRIIWLDTVLRLSAKGRTLLTSKTNLLSPEEKAELLMD